MILDVGCGNNPKGDINVDLFLVTRQADGHSGLTETNADIVCDGHYLPFVNDCFDKVISHHVIEHSKTPFKFFKELMRVSKKDVEISCPHKYSKIAKMPYHVSFFDMNWFYNACMQFDLRRASIRVSFEPIRIFFITLPFNRAVELVVNIEKEVK